MEGTKTKSRCKYVLMALLGFLCVLILLTFGIQLILYKWATLKCSASHLKNYSYPGGGEKGLVPLDSLLVQQDPRWWGSSFINIPSNKDGLSNGASTGVYYRTWGPLWWTYTYQDIMSQETFVFRDRPIAIGGSHKFMRCDGTGPEYIINEGSHVIMNRIRAFFGMYATRTYSIWENNVKIAESEQLGGTGQSQKQIVFKKINEAEPFASCFLKDKHYHGRFDEWFVQVDPDSILPPWIPNGVAVMMAFRQADMDATERKKHSEAGNAQIPKTPSMLAEVTNDAPVAFLAKAALTNASDVVNEAAVDLEQQQPVKKIEGTTGEPSLVSKGTNTTEFASGVENQSQMEITN